MEEFVFRPKIFYVKIDQFGHGHPVFPITTAPKKQKLTPR